MFSMTSSSKESAAKVIRTAKRKPEDDLEFRPILRKHKETSELKETTEGFACSLQQKHVQDNLISAKAVPITQKTLYVSHLPRQTTISDIIDFFKDVGEVVHVRLCVDHQGENVHSGFVEFASPNEANKALEKKNCECLHSRKISIRVAVTSQTRPPKFCLDHKVWPKDFLQQDETPPDFFEEVLVIANLSPQTKISHIKGFFSYVARVVSVRLVLNDKGEHVGYGFVEFSSAYEANKALEEKNGEYLQDHKILLMKGPHETPAFAEEAAITKTLFVTNLSTSTEISDIINFFNEVGEVVHVRFVVNSQGHHLRWGFVELASAIQVEKALVKNGEYLQKRQISVSTAKTVPLSPPKFCLDHKVWYEDYLRRESLLIGEVEGLEEVAARKKTLFIDNIPFYVRQIIPTIINFFKDVGEIYQVRIIVDDTGEHLGCAFVEFTSSNEAEKALQMKTGQYFCRSKIFLDVAKRAPYPVGPKYNIAKKLWYDDYLRRGRMKTNQDRKKQDLLRERMKTKAKGPMKVMGIFCGKKCIFSDDD